MADMNVKGGYFAPKNYLKVNEGGSHDENPNGGVQIGVDPNGTPNMLEEGEPVYNDFVYSDNIVADAEFLERHKLPTKYAGWLYSRIADDLFEARTEMPLDAIEENGAEVMLTRLAECQEEQKQVTEQRELESMLASLSPEEQEAFMQMMAQESQQPSPEEMAMAQQQAMPQEQMHMEGVPMAPEEMALPGQEMPMMAAYGGPINRFDDGGRPNWFTRATLNAAMADPSTLAVSQASGWTQDENNDWTQHDMDEPGAEELRESLNLISQIPMEIMTGGLLSGMIGAGSTANALSKTKKGVNAAKKANAVSQTAKDLDKARKDVQALRTGLEESMDNLAKAMSDYRKFQTQAETAKVAGGAKTKLLKKVAKAAAEIDKYDEEVKNTKVLLDGAKVNANAKWWANAGNAILDFPEKAAGKVGSLISRMGSNVSGKYSNLHPILKDVINSVGSGLTLTGVASPTISGIADIKRHNDYLRSLEPLGPAAPPMTYNYDDLYLDGPADSTAVPGAMRPQVQSSEPELDWSWLPGQANERANGGPVNKFVPGGPLSPEEEWYLQHSGSVTSNAQPPRVSGDISYAGYNGSYSGKSPEEYYMMLANSTTPLQRPTRSITPGKAQYDYSPLNGKIYYDASIKPTAETGDPNATRMLSTAGRDIVPMIEGAIGLYDAAQPADRMTAQRANANLISGNMRLIDPRLMQYDTNQTLNRVVNQNNALAAQIRNSGAGPSTMAGLIAADYNGAVNAGNAVAQDRLLNEQAYNTAISGYNNNESARAQSELNRDARNQAMLEAIQRTNIQNNLFEQQANNQYESQKWAAVGNQVQRALDAMYANATSNFNMNMVNSNPAFEGYGISPYGWVNYMAAQAARNKAAQEVAEQSGYSMTPKATMYPLQPSVPSYIDGKYMPDFAEEFNKYAREAHSKLSPAAQIGFLRGCGGHIKRTKK